MLKRHVVSVLFALTATAVMFAAEEPAQAPVPPASEAQPEVKADPFAGVPDVLAKVNGKEITKQMMRDKLAEQLPPGLDIASLIDADRLQVMLPHLVRDMVTAQALTDAMKAEKIEPNEETARKSLAEHVDNPENRKKAEEAGINFDNEIEKAAKNPMMQLQAATFEFFKLHGIDMEAKVSEDEAKAAYLADPEKYRILRASHILITAESGDNADAEALAKAEDLLRQLQKDPSEFEELAKTESKCPSGQNGGALGEFSRGQMVPEFEEAAFALTEPGSFSPSPVKTNFGYHIIRLDGVGTEESSVKAAKEELVAEKMQQALTQADELLNSIVAQADIEYLVPMPEEE